jgi:demethylmenaquinone methyltransferase/2-methoxy-6-polyprenyl-1,4-benzoquinol methylase
MQPTTSVTPYPESGDNKGKQVEQMFDNISHRYDFLNRFLSLGIDIYWRNKAIACLKNDRPSVMLDIATGTADFALSAMKLNPTKIIGVDISEGMLSYGRVKIANKKLQNTITLQKADSQQLPFEDNSFDAATVAFGVRNFENLEKGLKEISRVLKPGAQLVVLEFSKPTIFPVQQIFQFYFKFILPTIGKLVSKDARAYTYLPDSVNAFPEGQQFLDIFARSGFSQLYQTRLTFGICSIYSGRKK